MPYVRKHGNQLAIVHGERDPETKKVQQHTLFTLYSKAEARAAIGKGEQGDGDAHRFRAYLQRQYPQVRFDWTRIAGEIEKNVDGLPAEYPYREARLLGGRFHQDLLAFAQQLILADPQDLQSSADVIRQHRHELEFIARTIDWRIQELGSKLAREPNEFTADNPFYWRFELQGRAVPPETWEMATSLFEKMEYDRAEAVFRLLLETFPEEVEIHSYLGHIALERDDFDQAIDEFSIAVREGRKMFPKRIAKSDLWTNHDTRPFIRGLASLADAYNRAGRYEEALATCDRAEKEARDYPSANTTRAEIYLNLGRWNETVTCAKYGMGLWPHYAFIAGFAAFELGNEVDALTWFLHAAINNPRAARMLLGVRERTKPANSWEAEDHNQGVEFSRTLRRYLASQSKKAKKFFRGLMSRTEVIAMLDEVEDVRARRLKQRDGTREAFDRRREMESMEYAVQRAKELLTGSNELLV